MTGEVYTTLTTPHLMPQRGGGLSGRNASEGGNTGNDDDDYFDVDPASDQAILGFDLDTPPGPGYCAVPWYPNPRHSAHGRDVRWESTFKSFLLVRSRQSRAGGVYTDKTDMEFALQGLHPAPESQEMTSFFDCLELWKADCRAGVHDHTPPPSSKPIESPQKVSHPSPTTAFACSTPPNSPCASPSIFRSPRRMPGSSPSTPSMARRDARIVKNEPSTPVTPFKARGPSSPLNPASADLRSLRASPMGMLGTPAPVVMPPRSPHTPSPGQHGPPPPPYPSSVRGPVAPRGGSSSMVPSSATRPSASMSTVSALASPSAIRSLAAASTSATSPPAPSRPGTDEQRLLSTFIQPVWFSADSRGVGLILTSSWEYARDLHATHGNIDVVTDSEKLNTIVRQFFEG